MVLGVEVRQVMPTLEQRALPFDCLECGTKLLSEWVWRHVDREAAKAQGFARHDGGKLCSRCHIAARRAGKARLHRPPQPPTIFACLDCGRKCSTTDTRKRYPDLCEETVAGAAGRCYRDYKIHLGHQPGGRNYVRSKLREERREAFLDDWELLRDDGVLPRVAARRIGVKYGTFLTRLMRARKAGDQRGSLVPFARDMRDTS